MRDIHRMDLKNFDLNLLRVLDALLTEGSVSRAATRLRLSQPATSNALMRLRVQLEDPLFVRSRSGMVPTPRARELKAPVAQALANLSHVFNASPRFDPRVDTKTFVIAASDHAQLLVLPALSKTMANFPKVKVRVVPLPRDFPREELETGALDLVIGAFDLAPGDAAPKGLRRQVLASESYVIAGRRGHPALKTGAKVDLSLPQLHVSPRGGTEGKFERKTRLDRNIVMFTPHYLVAPWVLASTDMLAALPERVARRFAEQFALQVVPVTVPHQQLKVVQLWHPWRQKDAAHVWLRGWVLSAAKT